MPARVVFHSAIRYSLQQLAAYFNAAYEGYTYPVTTTAEQLARRVREESLDLDVSAVMETGGCPVGLFLVARRGDESWCGGFGINRPQRGRRLSAPLAAEMLARTRLAGAGSLQLEVLHRNDAAKAAYEQAGFVVARELLILAWSAPPGAAETAGPAVRRVEPARHLDQLRLGDRPRPAWQRAVASLHVRSEMEAYATADGKSGVLLVRTSDGGVRLLSFRGDDVGALTELLRHLQRGFRRVMVINEPTDSPYLDALFAAGFAEIDRQYEMRREFAGG